MKKRNLKISGQGRVYDENVEKLTGISFLSPFTFYLLELLELDDEDELLELDEDEDELLELDEEEDEEEDELLLLLDELLLLLLDEEEDEDDDDDEDDDEEDDDDELQDSQLGSLYKFQQQIETSDIPFTCQNYWSLMMTRKMMMRMKMTSFKTIGQGIVHGKNFDSREFLSYSINLLELLELDEEEDDDDEDEELKTN